MCYVFQNDVSSLELCYQLRFVLLGIPQSHTYYWQHRVGIKIDNHAIKQICLKASPNKKLPTEDSTKRQRHFLSRVATITVITASRPTFLLFLKLEASVVTLENEDFNVSDSWQ
jgi:hypothetical protein